jgi:hypothetical protein
VTIIDKTIATLLFHAARGADASSDTNTFHGNARAGKIMERTLAQLDAVPVQVSRCRIIQEIAPQPPVNV